MYKNDQTDDQKQNRVCFYRYKKNLKTLFVVHPTNFIRIVWNIFKPLIRWKPVRLAGPQPVLSHLKASRVSPQSQVWEEADVRELPGWAQRAPELRAAHRPSRCAQVLTSDLWPLTASLVFRYYSSNVMIIISVAAYRRSIIIVTQLSWGVVSHSDHVEIRDDNLSLSF